jgi:phage terminase large subunit GpA-like protein
MDRRDFVTSMAALAAAGFADARSIYASARQFYAPKAVIPVVEWAETERMLSAESAAEAGRYSLARTPWWREVLEVLADEETEEVVVAKSSQIGYTEMLNTFIGWCMAQDPSSMLMIQPTVEMAEAWSKERLAPMLRDTPALRGILRAETRGMARSSDDTLRRKAFPGGWLAIIGANSPASLASRPVRRIIGDERDRWPISAGMEGDPLELASKRAITYWNRKIVEGGTPTEDGASPTWEKWLESDQRHWMVRCPHCGEGQRLRWRDDAGQYHLVCDRDEEGRLIPESAQYRCAHCACLIDERHKAAMIASGAWVPTYPGRRIRGYHVWAGYSPWMSWAEIVRQFESARGSEPRLRTFVNTIIGEPFAPAAEKLEPGVLAARAEPMPEVPAWVGLLTAGVDVQADRLEYVVVGWGADERAAVLEYDHVEGDPGHAETWAVLTTQLAQPRSGMHVQCVCADTGYRPETVWRWAGGRLPFRALPTKGMDGRGRLIIQKPAAVTHKHQRRPWLVGTDTAKDALAARLRSAPEGPQGVRFSASLAPEYFEHLTAEKSTTVYVASRPVRRWVLQANRRNEGLDCTLLALAALHAQGVRAIASLGSVAAQRTAGGTQPAAPAPQPPAGVQVPSAALKPAPRRGGWVHGWRK